MTSRISMESDTTSSRHQQWMDGNPSQLTLFMHYGLNAALHNDMYPADPIIIIHSTHHSIHHLLQNIILSPAPFAHWPGLPVHAGFSQLRPMLTLLLAARLLPTTLPLTDQFDILSLHFMCPSLMLCITDMIKNVVEPTALNNARMATLQRMNFK